MKQLSARQLEIMEILWDSGELSAAEIHDTLSRRRKVSRTTVRTTIERMERKGWLKHRSIGRTFVYTAAVNRESGIGRRTTGFLDEVFGGRPEALMSALLDFRGLDDDEVDRIRSLLTEAKKRNRGKQ